MCDIVLSVIKLNELRARKHSHSKRNLLKNTVKCTVVWSVELWERTILGRGNHYEALTYREQTHF